MNLSNYCHPTCLLDRPDLLSASGVGISGGCGYVSPNHTPCGLINCTLCYPYLYAQLINNNNLQSPVLVLSSAAATTSTFSTRTTTVTTNSITVNDNNNNADVQSMSQHSVSPVLPDSSYCYWLSQPPDMYKQIYQTQLVNGTCNITDFQSSASVSTSSSSPSFSFSSTPSSFSATISLTTSSTSTTPLLSTSSTAGLASQTPVTNTDIVGSVATPPTNNMTTGPLTDSFSAMSLDTNMYTPIHYCDTQLMTNSNMMYQLMPHPSTTSVADTVISSSTGNVGIQPIVSPYPNDKFYEQCNYGNYIPYYTKSVLPPTIQRYTVNDYNTTDKHLMQNTMNTSNTSAQIGSDYMGSMIDESRNLYHYAPTGQYLQAYNMSVVQPDANAHLWYSLLANQQMVNTTYRTLSDDTKQVKYHLNPSTTTSSCLATPGTTTSSTLSSPYTFIRINLNTNNPFDFSRLVCSVNPVNLDKSLLENSRYFMIKSDYAYNVSQSMKYGVWCSTRNGNQCLNEAYQSMQNPQKPLTSAKGHIILLFSIRESGYLSGVAEMTSPVNLQKRAGIWQDLRFRGEFSVKWLYIKPIPNYVLKHVLIESYDNRPVTVLRDTSEILPSSKGEELLRIVHNYKPHTTNAIDSNLSFMNFNPTITTNINVPNNTTITTGSSSTAAAAATTMLANYRQIAVRPNTTSLPTNEDT